MLVATDKDLPERIFICGTFETCRYVTSYFFMHTFLFTFFFRYLAFPVCIYLMLTLPTT